MKRDEGMPHAQAQELLPWLVNDTLAADERRLVDAHARSCVVCRRDLVELERLRESFSESADPAGVPAPDMRRINARIDALVERDGRFGQLVAGLRDSLARPWRLAFAAQSLLLVALLTVLLWPQPATDEYTTLTTPQALPAGDYLRVVFDPDLDAAATARLIDGLALAIVEGPSERGVALLRITPPAGGEDADALAARLLGRPGVLFAQPVATAEP